MAKIGKLYNESGTLMYPASVTDAIYDVANEQTLSDTLEVIFGEIFPLELTLTATPTLSEYNGITSAAITAQWTIKRAGQNVNPTAQTLKKGAGTVTTQLTDRSATVALNAEGITTFTLEVTADGITGTATASVEMVRASYFGFGAQTMTDPESTLTKQTLSHTPAGSYSLTNEAAGSYLWLCIPTNKNISKVTSSGFDVPMEAPVTVGNHKCYRSSNALAAGTMNIVIYG